MAGKISFVISAFDKYDSAHIRSKTRPHHMDFIKSNKDILVFAGPYLDDSDESIGSLYVVSVPDEDSAREFIESDPYSSAGLFQKIEIRRWRLVIDNIHG